MCDIKQNSAFVLHFDCELRHHVMHHLSKLKYKMVYIMTFFSILSLSQ